MLDKSIISLLNIFIKFAIIFLFSVRERQQIRYFIPQLLISEALLVDLLTLLGYALVMEKMADSFILNNILIVSLFDHVVNRRSI